MPEGRPPLSEPQREQFSALILLDRVITEPQGYHAALMEARDDQFLDPVFSVLLREDLVEVGEDDHYRPTAHGRQVYQNLLNLRRSYLAHFEIFARVDLAEGAFANPNDPMDHPRWSDLRLAVTDYKGVDPYRVVFLAMLSDETFFEGRDWKFDLALGSTFYEEMQELVQAQITVDELAYDTETGEHISGEAVIEDVILQGAQLNREYGARERERQQSLLPEGEGGGNGQGGVYDPWVSMAFYCESALYVEAMWLEGLW